MKSGHSTFAQSTEALAPLTEEEKKQKADELMARIKAARAAKAQTEAAEAIEKEKKRRLDGQKMLEARERQKDQARPKV